MVPSKILVQNVTGELLQPARIYYSVEDRRGVLAALKKLRCVEADPPNARWVWLWDAEAKGLKFLTEYKSIPKQRHPIVIGSFTFRGEHQMLLELRSFERVLHALPFFDKRIDRRLATATKLRVVNRLFSASETPLPGKPMDPFFDRDDIRTTGADEFLAESQRITEENPNPVARARALLSLVEEMAARKTPEIEELDLAGYYEDGIGGLQLALKLRGLQALEHWNGHTEITMRDLLERVMSGGWT